VKVRILGCSGGIGGRDLRTTSLLVDDDILIDCGTGVGDLTLEEMVRVDHLFLTHAHLDHIACLPLLIDTVCDMRGQPLTVHASAATIAVLRTHIFNWAIWPDFSEIPSVEKPFLRFLPLSVGATIEIAGRSFSALPADHTVPAVGYRIDSGVASLVFSGDTGPCAELWTEINAIGNLRHLIIETAFSNSEAPRAALSKHLCPDTLAAELESLARPTDIYITHLKPGQSELIMREIEQRIGTLKPRMLRKDQVFDL
jgi:ribonuclease BN (tRNA processing enzyme)